MRSQLTRSVFRRLLSTEGLIFSCPTQSTLRQHPRPISHVPIKLRYPQRRTLFGFSRKPPRQPKEPDLDPGFDEILDCMRLLMMGARPPETSTVVGAWSRYFDYKLGKAKPINSMHALQLLRLFEHLRVQKDIDGNFQLPDQQIRNAQTALDFFVPDEDSGMHAKLARALYSELVQRQDGDINIHQRRDDLGQLITILAKAGEGLEARELLVNYNNDADSKPFKRHVRIRLWQLIHGSFMKQQNETELLKTLQLVMEMDAERRAQIIPTLTQQTLIFYLRRNDVEATKHWMRKCEEENVFQTSYALSEALKFSIKNNEVAWCKEIFRKVINDEKITKSRWDLVLQWAAGVAGKGVEDVERMLNVMVERQRRNNQAGPDTVTINRLVELAMSLNDPYLAERYINLGAKFGILPDAKTHILQLRYRVDAGDMSGAQASYAALQSEEILEEEDLPAINQYLRALCSKPNTYDRVTSILSDLEARKSRLEADTTSDIAMMFMERDEEQDLYDILQTNVYNYTLEERGRIAKRFIDFCLDRNRNNAQAWEAYQVLRSVFDETSTETRTQLMIEFFERGRSDMACYVFGHMRQHDLVKKRPTRETYIACIEGIASCEDRESLEMVHNMFKMDSTMEPNTKLYNALMLAYTSVGDGNRALDFWDDITNSREGPSYQSLEVVFRACEMNPFGDRTARDVWSKMRRMEIEITRDVWQAYIGAVAGHGKIDEAKELIQNGEKEFGLKPDFMTLGIFYNAMPGQNRKDDIEEWGKGMYTEAWAELEEVGRTTTDGGFVTLFKIKRKWKA